MLTDEGFIKISRKKKKPSQLFSEKVTNTNDFIDKSAVLRRIKIAEEEIRNSDFYSNLLSVVNQGLEDLEFESILQVLCYGLGSFGQCMSARYQLALLLLLKERFLASIYIHDPVFTPEECDILNELGCQVIIENEEGRRKITNIPTLLYLPHCPKQIVNNFLFANWGPVLSYCLILGNSFSHIVETNPRRLLHKSAAYILNIFPYVKELGIVNCFQFTDIFNELALHIFLQKKLYLAQDLWSFQEQPSYDSEEIEFITQKIISTLKL